MSVRKLMERKNRAHQVRLRNKTFRCAVDNCPLPFLLEPDDPPGYKREIFINDPINRAFSDCIIGYLLKRWGGNEKNPENMVFSGFFCHCLVVLCGAGKSQDILLPLSI